MSDETPQAEVSLSEQIANRRAARERIAKLGRPLYPNRWDPTHLVSGVVARWGLADAAGLEAEPEAERHVRVPGRILAIRKMGKAVFLDLSDGAERVQAYLRKDALSGADWELYEQLDLGDHVGVTGTIFRTRTGELSVKAEALDFLAKSLRPLPDKWHGLTDVERRYRQRYVDLIVYPEVAADFRDPGAARLVHPALLRRPRLPRGRDADDAADRGRGRGPPLRHAPQRPRHRPLSSGSRRSST